jgi:hypothetical protein
MLAHMRKLTISGATIGGVAALMFGMITFFTHGFYTDTIKLREDYIDHKVSQAATITELRAHEEVDKREIYEIRGEMQILEAQMRDGFDSQNKKLTEILLAVRK